LQPYVIKQGDHLALLAYKFGFDADTVWNDPQNVKLRQLGQLSQDPNILWPTNVLYIPDQVNKPPAMQRLTTGTTNTFVTDPPAVTISLQFGDSLFASQAYSVQELPQLTGLTTSEDGTTTLSIPVTLQTFTIVFTESGTTFDFNTGHLDPIDTLSGVFQRLQNLGYIDLDATASPSPDIELIRSALRAFKAAEAGGFPAPADSSPASAPSSPSDANPPAPPAPTSSPASSPTPPPSDSSPAPISSSASGPSLPGDADSEPPPSGPASSPEPSAGVQDNAGLSDDGKLNEATSKLLFAAHLS
jgi:hypothetical protein